MMKRDPVAIRGVSVALLSLTAWQSAQAQALYQPNWENMVAAASKAPATTKVTAPPGFTCPVHPMRVGKGPFIFWGIAGVVAGAGSYFLGLISFLGSGGNKENELYYYGIGFFGLGVLLNGGGFLLGYQIAKSRAKKMCPETTAEFEPRTEESRYLLSLESVQNPYQQTPPTLKLSGVQSVPALKFSMSF